MRSGRDKLRAANAIVAALMLALFLLHGVANSFQLVGIGTAPSKAISHTLLALCVAHAAIGVALTVDTLRAQREAGASYPRANARFWAVRVTGLLVAVLIALHVVFFWRSSGGPVRLAFFGDAQLVASVLLVACIGVHALLSARPLMVALGIGAPGERAADLAIALVVLLAAMVAAFVVYYLRWSVV